jgi:phage shock protein E
MEPGTILAVAAVVAVFFILSRKGRRSPAEVATMRAAVAQDGVLVDVRSPAEFASGHVDGSLNIPLGDLPARQGELGAPSRPVVVCCASGTRSALARRLLAQKGFSSVMDLGRWHNWTV